MSGFFSKFNESTTASLGLYFTAIVVGYMPFYIGNLTANDEDSAYVYAVAFMAMVAAFWGWCAYLWMNSLKGKKVITQIVSGGLGTLVSFAFLYALYDAFIIPIYFAALAFPAALFIRKKRIWMAMGCLVLLAFFLTLSLTPSGRVWRYSDMFYDCACCGYQQRAVRELLRQGDKGCEALISCITKRAHPLYSRSSVCDAILQEMKECRSPNRQRYEERIQNLKDK